MKKIKLVLIKGMIVTLYVYYNYLTQYKLKKYISSNLCEEVFCNYGIFGLSKKTTYSNHLDII